MSLGVEMRERDDVRVGLSVETRNLTVRFGATAAINDLTISLEPGKIHGLLGRNGSGKSTLAATFAAFRAPTSGSVRVGGHDPYEHARTASQICLIREGGDIYDQQSVTCALALSRSMRPYWDEKYAKYLIRRFQLPLGKKAQRLSRGQRSALGVTLGLASRAPLTIFDESYLGMDAPSREIFYEELLPDYVAHPRTIIVSTHLIGEVASLFEEVLVIDRGRLVVQGDADDLRTRGVEVVGPAATVDRFVSGLTVLAERRLGATTSATVYGRLNRERERDAAAAGLSLGPVGLQDLFIHLTSPDDPAIGDPAAALPPDGASR